MSHFVVVVIGDDVEGQLAPYQENGNGDLPQELLAFEDNTEEVVQGWKDYPLTTLASVGEHEVNEYENIEEYARDYHGYEEHEGKYGYWHNPNSKWDWWEVGGRWGGYFPVKENPSQEYKPVTRPAAKFRDPDEPMPNKADSILIQDLDVERARDEAETRAREQFGQWRTCFEEHGKALTFAEIRDANNNDIDKARKIYNAQPAVAAHSRYGVFFGDVVKDFGYDEEAYVKLYKNQALVPYAVVKDGEWHAKGEMGWFGCSNDDVEQDTWNEEFHKLLTDLPPGTLLTAVDCHV